MILVDDQAMNTFTPRFMPDTYRWIVHPGTKFVDGLSAPPLCCPDRAGILTGQYPHNNGVFSNDPGYSQLVNKTNTLPVWLRRSGYRTGFVGKFLNRITTYQGQRPAPGFDYWFSLDQPVTYYNYSVSENGRAESYGSTRRQYSTDVLTRRARKFIAATGRRKPWFLWLAYHAPHIDQEQLGGCGPGAPIPPTENAFLRHGQYPLPRPPSYDEGDVSDKPPWVADKTKISAARRARIKMRFDCTAAAMWAADRDIGRLMHWLKRRGELKNTIVFYLSDNGFYFGEHRISQGKSLPYEPALQVPYAIKVPDAYRGAKAPPHRSTAVVTNEDVAPTILDYAGGVRPCPHNPHHCRTLDGRSVRPLLGGSGSFPRNRAALVEINASGVGQQYAGVRTRRYLYVEYVPGEKELYDLRRDPNERTNVAASPAYASIEAALAKKLHRLERCSGTHGSRPC